MWCLGLKSFLCILMSSFRFKVRPLFLPGNAQGAASNRISGAVLNCLLQAVTVRRSVDQPISHIQGGSYQSIALQGSHAPAVEFRKPPGRAQYDS